MTFDFMGFTVERPIAFYGLLLLIPVILIAIYKYRRISRNMSFFQSGKDLAYGKNIHPNHILRVIILRTVFRCIAWALLVLGYAGFSWGTYLEPVQKNGDAVSFVFDISYSMLARDGLDRSTRLSSSVNYAKLLLSHLEDNSVSVILAKGDGVVVVPLTEDKIIVETLLESLNPRLMSSTGTSLGNGVSTALKSFPSNSSLTNRIWLFTDGEETDGLLEKSLTECLKAGVNVSIIGFGREHETTVLAGDGKTKINTALRGEQLRAICRRVQENNPDASKNGEIIEFVDSTEPGSALQLLKPLSAGKKVLSGDDEETGTITYELKPVLRYSIFLLAAFVFYVLSFILSELNTDIFSRKKMLITSMVCVMTLFTSCSSRVEGAKKILTGSWAWQQSRYNNAVASFLQTAFEADKNDDFDLAQYAVYDLAVTYLMQNETKAALDRFSQIDENASDNVLYAAYYNMGIIAHRNGEYEKAAEFFRSALKKDSSKTEAKINLELSLLKAGNEGKVKEKALKPATESSSENKSKENSVFNVIREYEKRQWKNSESGQNSNAAEDF